MKNLMLFTLLMILFCGVTVVAQAPLKKSSDRFKMLSEKSSTDATISGWIFFTDKGPAVIKQLANPEESVSRRSLDRRKKLPVTGLDETDLPVYREYIRAIEAAGLRVKRTSKWMNGVTCVGTVEAFRRVAGLRFVESIDIIESYRSVRPVEVIKSEGHQFSPTPSPAGTNLLNYGNSYTQLQQLRVPELHNIGYSGQGVMIAVLDAGFNLLAHEAFDSMNIVAAWDFVNNDPGVGDSSDMGTGSHGTKTLSTIGGFKEGKLIGPAYRASYLLAKTENTDSETPVEEDNWIAAMEWADSIGIDVSSTSLGYIGFDQPYTSYTWQSMDGNTCRITRAADLAVKKGIVVVNSAGNEGYHPTQNTLGAPSDGDSVLAIGAVDATGNRVDFSSVGNTVDGRIKPDVMAMGTGVVVVSAINTTGYVTASGTSFSCPLAAGVAGLLIEQFPTASPMDIVRAMKETASNSANPNREYGWGIINAVAARGHLLLTIDNVLPPGDFTLEQNYPNPFNPETVISYTLAKPGVVDLSVYAISGEKVATLFSGMRSAGFYTQSFNASGLASGVYIYRLSTFEGSVSRKMMLIR